MSCCSQRRRKRRWVTSSLPPTRRDRWIAEQNRYRKTASRISRSRSLMRPRPGTAGRSNLEKLTIGRLLLKRAEEIRTAPLEVSGEMGGRRTELSFRAPPALQPSGYFSRYE